MKRKQPVKTFDNVASRDRITNARAEVRRIRGRLNQLNTGLVGELTTRIREVDAALLHLREYAEMIIELRTLEGRD